MPIALPSSGSSGTWGSHCRCRVSSGPSTGALDCARLAASGFGHSDCQPNVCRVKAGMKLSISANRAGYRPPSHRGALPHGKCWYGPAHHLEDAPGSCGAEPLGQQPRGPSSHRISPQRRRGLCCTATAHHGRLRKWCREGLRGLGTPVRNQDGGYAINPRH
ncbi:hypothetical protein ACCO45_011856 [Purpureocillium lilacinum]|uniref:Uncharacterized protein n=1 Tax=Purpureocillium lilacinum TaxID=33203 RepID=A0ACC4DF01_PURLI